MNLQNAQFIKEELRKDYRNPSNCCIYHRTQTTKNSLEMMIAYTWTPRPIEAPKTKYIFPEES
ncbi:MAG: hypothetical protein CL666_03935 [Balneola sp.]|nr:hypothetical protein [Balneola sp.]